MSKLLKSKFLLGVLAVVIGMSLAGSALAADGAITKTLKKGMKDVQVKYLQQTLNAKGFTVAKTGAGSVGSETTYFGPATVAAAKAFQAANKLVVDGIFGAKSRAALGNSNPNPNPNPNPTPNPTGPVSVTLANDNPASGTLIATQATADLAHFTFTGNGTVTSVTLQRTGVSNNSVFDSVYLYQGNTRLTESASVNNSGVITFAGMNLVVNGSMTVAVKADINSGATSETAGVTLTGYTTAGSTSATSANAAGNIMNIVSASGVVGTITLGTNSATGTSVNAGTTQYTFWSAPVTVGTHSMLLKSLSLHFIGSAPNDALANIKLYVDGTPVGTSTGPNALGYVVFDFGASPLTVLASAHTFDVRADVVKGSNRTVQLSLQNRADFMMTDSQANVNVGITSFSTNSGASVTISIGSVSVTIDPSFQSMTNVTGGATNVAIGKYKLHGYGEDVKVNTLYVRPTLASQSSVAAAGLNNVSLYFNGSQIGSSQNMTSATTQLLTYNLGSSLIIPAGVDSLLEIRADLTTYSTNLSYVDGTVSVALTDSSNTASGAIASNNNGQGMNSMDSTIDVPGSVQSTSGLTIQTGLIAIAQNVAMGATSISPNAVNQKIGSFVIQNQSTSEGVHVTNLNVGLALTTANSTNYSNLYTSETSGSGATKINPTYSAAGATSWNNFPVDFILAPGATKTLDVFADIGTATGSLVTDMYLTAVGASSNSSVCSPTKTGGTVNGCNNYATSPETNPAAGQAITIQAGTFNGGGVVIGSSTQPQYVAVGSTGATDATMATFNFKSTNGTTTISELKFRVTSSTGTTVSSVRVGSQTAPVVSGIAYLTGLNIIVPNGGSGLNVPVYMTYAAVGTNQAGTSGALSFVEMTYVKYQVGTTVTTLTGGSAVTANTILAGVGASPANSVSGTFPTLAATSQLTFTSTSLLQPGMILDVYKPTDTGASKDSILEVQSIDSTTTATLLGLSVGSNTTTAQLTFSFFSIPQNAAYASSVNNGVAMTDAGVSVAAGATSTTDSMVLVGSKPTLAVIDASTLLVGGSPILVGSVSVTADPKGDIKVNALPLTFNSTGYVTVAGTNLVVKNAADQSTINTTDGGLTVAAGSSGNVTITFTGGYTITAGQTVTFDIYATPATVSNGPNANHLSMKLNTTPANFLWTDVAGGATGTSTGTLIYNYPTNSSVIND